MTNKAKNEMNPKKEEPKKEKKSEDDAKDDDFASSIAKDLEDTKV